MCVHVELQGAGAVEASVLWRGGAQHQKGGLAIPAGALQVWYAQKGHEPGTSWTKTHTVMHGAPT